MVKIQLLFMSTCTFYEVCASQAYFLGRQAVVVKIEKL